ncbi:hypothetical protein MRB53_003608 [Persea americana]|uniref:Uncharacterized protein n=1 Tax=Persea americana TaxID=3435 RepID=A0ACC2MYP9_PERAE|nr:hypothetical protein MRB53_003608 [Persea americana]
MGRLKKSVALLQPCFFLLTCLFSSLWFDLVWENGMGTELTEGNRGIRGGIYNNTDGNRVDWPSPCANSTSLAINFARGCSDDPQQPIANRVPLELNEPQDGRSPNHTSSLAQVRPRRSRISKPVQSKTIIVHPSQPLDQLVVDRKREAFRQHRRVEDPSLLQPPAEESTLVQF